MTIVELMLRLERIPPSRWDMEVTISRHDGEIVSYDIFGGPFRLDFNHPAWVETDAAILPPMNPEVHAVAVIA